MKKHRKQPPWVSDLLARIKEQWRHDGPGESIHAVASYRHKGWRSWVIQLAPVLQEIYGGKDDGKKVWTGFTLPLRWLSRLPGMTYFEVTDVSSLCVECRRSPSITAAGTYQGHYFFLEVSLEPVEGAEAVEVVDSFTGKVGPKKGAVAEEQTAEEGSIEQ